LSTIFCALAQLEQKKGQLPSRAAPEAGGDPVAERLRTKEEIQMRTFRRYFAVAATLLVVAGTFAATPRPTTTQDSLPPEFVPLGKVMFKQYCAACHGLNAKGHGPARSALKVPAADLATLSKRHGGEFPYDYVTNVLRFGPGVAAHGSGDMPTWGGIFQNMENYNEASVRKRISNLCDYLASIQEK
jgi:mono/diheme cytochrome c family protein